MRLVDKTSIVLHCQERKGNYLVWVYIHPAKLLNNELVAASESAT